MDTKGNKNVPETKLCKHCRSEMDKKAKVCPTCHKKQSKKGGCLIALIVLAVLILLPILMFSACFKAADEAVKKDKKEKEDNKVVAEEMVYDEDGIKIYYTGMIEDTLGVDINFRVENDSDKNVTVQLRNFSVDGYTVEPVFSVEAAAGTKANDNALIMKSDMEKNKLEYKSIKEATMNFHIFDSKNWADSKDSENVTIKLR